MIHGSEGTVSDGIMDNASADKDLIQFPTGEAARHLRSPFPLDDDARDTYRRDGFVVLHQVFNPDVITAARPHLIASLRRHWPMQERSADDRDDAYSRAFVQITKVGLQDEVMRAFTHAPRIGRLAAELMGVRGVRIFCEDWLLKRPGAGETPWHQDCCVFPFESEATITAWIPIHDVPAGMGLPRYARGSQVFGLAPVENISEESNGEFERIMTEHGFEVVRVPPLASGDVCFHDGLTFHGASPNESAEIRYVLALHMFADGACIREPTTSSMRHQLNDFAPGLKPGDPAVVPAWPLIYSADWEPLQP
jgi:ectoine hydroxylase-related dioxygenase (phytanoyl-CoA dioxygenase family)